MMHAGLGLDGTGAGLLFRLVWSGLLVSSDVSMSADIGVVSAKMEPDLVGESYHP